MSKTTRLILCGLVAGLMVASAQAAELALVGDATWSNLNVTDLPTGINSASTSAKAGYGGGLLLNFPMARAISLEVGGIYASKKADINESTILGPATGSVSAKYIQVPADLRFWLAPMLSIGVGGYWEHGVSGDFSSTKKNDTGLLGSVALRFPLGMSGTKFLVDGRYYYGLSNIDNSGTDTEKYRDIQVLVGFAFPLGMHHRGY